MQRRWSSRRGFAAAFSKDRLASSHKRDFSAMSLAHPSYIIWGSNTGIGKTLVSTGLSLAALNRFPSNVLYVKPVQTGFPEDSDARFVSHKVHGIHGKLDQLFISNQTLHVSEAAREKARSLEQNVSLGGNKAAAAAAACLSCKTLWSWSAPVSPHLAAEDEGGAVSDDALLQTLQRSLWGDVLLSGGKRWAFIETAGGVASPGPSGTLQCDMYRPLRLPGILVGDGKLGGISSTLAAYESLLVRGYETQCILLQDCGFSNEKYLSKHLNSKIPIVVLPPVPEDPDDDLQRWFNSSAKTFTELLQLLQDAHDKRLERLNELPEKASTLFWWPFTQHNLVEQKEVTVIDSRCGENFSVYKASDKEMVQTFDACASWWTQGPDLEMQCELSRQVAYAAGRYGHVMFPENVHEPALRCSELLLQGVGRNWANRVYFSDNGSTAVEIAIKMAFRKYAVDLGLTEAAHLKFKILGLRGSYHGDTLGAMEAQAASPYTGFRQQPWYTGRGLFLEPPTVHLRQSAWHLQLPDAYVKTFDCSSETWKLKEDVFASSRSSSQLAQHYADAIRAEISSAEASDSMTRIAALVLEPILHGAGGMVMVDPLFQRVLVQECKARRIPVIFDEVFTGFWRLGAESAAEILGCNPDIACYAKLLTGGIVPLSATLASESVFEAFQGQSKLDALLHGHSYTAHAIGCTAAVTAMEWWKDPLKNRNLVENSRLQELWDHEMVAELSNHAAVKRAVSLGTVFALELEAADGGYSSTSSKALISRLRDDAVYARPLGNVVYLMCGPLTSTAVCSRLLDKLAARLPL